MSAIDLTLNKQRDPCVGLQGNRAFKVKADGWFLVPSYLGYTRCVVRTGFSDKSLASTCSCDIIGYL